MRYPSLSSPLRPERPWTQAVGVFMLCGPLFAATSQEGGVTPRRAGGVAMETAALVMSGQEGGEIPIEGLAVPLGPNPGAAGTTRVLVVVEAAGAALLAEHAGGALAFDVLVYAVREDGTLGGTLVQSFEIELDLLGARLRQSGVKFVGDLGLTPGRYKLRAMVRSPETGKLGVRSLPLVVPEEPPGSDPPLVFEAEGAWIVAREAGPGASPEPLPAPAARPDLDGGVWAALGEAPAAVARSEPRETVSAGERALQRRLGEVLRDLAAGDDDRAQALLWELTSSALGGSEAGAREILDRAEARGFRAVADARPEGLGPVMMLYDWLYREGLRRNVPAVFTHARMTILKLVNLFLKSPNSGPVRERQAAQMLTSLGGVVQKAGLSEFSEELFLRAIALDSANEATLLALAFNDERVGNHEGAAVHLKELLKIDPAHGQARLRLAMALARTGKLKAARQHLERIVEGKASAGHPRWIVSLAYQELAKLHLADDRPEAADGVLRQGIERLPQDEKLHLLLAFVHDAQAEPAEAMRVLERLDLPRPESEGSPRHLYTLWPSEALAATRSSFITKAETQRVDLAMALGVEPAEDSAP